MVLESRRTPSSIYVYECVEFWESSTFRAVFETEKNAFQTNSSEMAAQHPFPSFSQLATQERKTIKRNGRSEANVIIRSRLLIHFHLFMILLSCSVRFLDIILKTTFHPLHTRMYMQMYV